MISFFISLAALVVGYFIYGKVVERIFGADKNRPTPAMANPDGVDYVAMPTWKVFLVQFLNIAGLGPIFGAIMGIMFGTSAFLWIVFGSIFAGGVHDYFVGMMSVRQNGASFPEIVGKRLGITAKQFMRGFSILLLILLGAVFTSGPASLLGNLTPGVISDKWWVIIVFVYFVSATLLPIDKLIGRIYPVFGFVLLFMAVGICVAMVANHAPIAEFTDGLANQHSGNLPIFPIMFVTIACGAISGFHSTQSPLMARCIKNEKYGRQVFYGSMIAEGVVALIWAAAAGSFFGSVQGLQQYTSSLPATANKAAAVVDIISRTWLGKFGSVLALLGVIVAPITSGDTALRSARLIAADFLHFDQKPIKNRLIIAVPIFALTFLLLQMNFEVLWRYFAWSNQTLAVFALWTIAVYLVEKHKNYFIALIPALFMTSVISSYLFIAPEGFHLNPIIAYSIGFIATITCLIFFIRYEKKINMPVK